MYQKPSNKSLNIFLIIIAVVLAICIVYFSFIHPFVKRLYFSPIVYEGEELYNSQEYLLYEEGERFKIFITKCGFVDKCIVSNFYFFDNSNRSSILLGKISNIFVLELSAGDNYEAVKNEIQNICEETLTPIGSSYEYYAFLTNEYGQNGYCIACCDENKTIRCILVIGCDSHFNITGYESLLYNNTTLNLEA